MWTFDFLPIHPISAQISGGAGASSSAQRGVASPQQGDLRLLGPPSGQGAGCGARTRNRRVTADLRADSLATVPPTSPTD
ncbi:hypothetical protein PoB_007504700 [Plakobranchus ocellatus]|uniref:Uncharacterized protein n=1 Tax=Plakobranchus ocellatus TaxID=259542 RepID=A0AAV4DW65_9GAST|nr:hypothetical protein PoB_007504700 [Plakobranchus ocellatus]